MLSALRRRFAAALPVLRVIIRRRVSTLPPWSRNVTAVAGTLAALPLVARFQRAPRAACDASAKPPASSVPAPTAPPQSQSHPGAADAVAGRASWLKRVLALLIDASVIHFSSSLLFYTFDLFSSRALSLITLMVLPLLYDLFFWYRRQSTLGKRFCRVKVVSATTPEAPLQMGQVVLRRVSFLLNALVFVDYLWALRDGRCLHDLIAGTVVVVDGSEDGLSDPRVTKL